MTVTWTETRTRRPTRRDVTRPDVYPNVTATNRDRDRIGVILEGGE